MSNFQTKVDFSTQIKEYANTEGTLSGSVNVQQYTTLGTDYADLPLGLDPLTTGISATYVYSTMGYFTGTTGSTTYYFTDSNMDIANPYLSTLNGTNSGLTQNVAAFIPTYSTTIDGNYFDVIYSGVSFDMTPASFEEYTVGEFSGVTFTNVLNYLSGTTYPWWFLKSGSTTWGEVKGRLQTDRMTIIEGAFPGYVLTSDNLNGDATWQPVSGLTWAVTACTSPLFVSNIVSCPTSADTLTIYSDTLALYSSLQFLLPFSGGSSTDGVLVVDSNGYVKTVPQFSGGSGTCITDLYVTNIHGCSPIHIQPTSSDNVYLVEGGGNVGIGVTSASTKLYVSGITIINSDYMMLSNTLTSIPPINFKGFIVAEDYTGDTGVFIYNPNLSAQTGFFTSNDSLATLQLYVGGSQYFRSVFPTPTTGLDFYQNKIILKGNNNTNGMIFNPTAWDPFGTFWWEIGGDSTMILKGNGGNGAYLGLALNPDGTEMPTSNLQIGGTGTTGSFQYKDGNEQDFYVLMSDNDGNANWQPLDIVLSGGCLFDVCIKGILSLIKDLYIKGLTVGTGGSDVGSTATTYVTNTAIGKDVLYYNTTGTYNTGVGADVLSANTTGSANTGVGSKSLSSNDTGLFNTAMGAYSLEKNTGGGYNTAIGVSSLNLNDNGIRNTAVGGYSLSNNNGNYNTSMGYLSMLSNTSGGYNISIGAEALYGNLIGSNNVAIGFQSLRDYDGNELVAIGNGSMQNTTSAGVENTAVGSYTLSLNLSGQNNTSMGYSSMLNNTTGSYNVAIGSNSLSTNNANNNVAIGHNSLQSNTTGFDNVSIGSNALYQNIAAFNNTAIGTNALYSNSGSFGRFNAAIGHSSLYSNVNGLSNSAIGVQSLYSNVDGSNNEALGIQSLFSNTIGSNNLGLGAASLYYNISGDSNVSIGHSSSQTNIGGNNNVVIGATADVGSPFLSNAIAIGAGSVVNTSNSMVLGDGSINVGIGTSSPTSTLHIEGFYGYNQLRLVTSYTPTGSTDVNGSVGDTAWDGAFIYIKTTAGWKRAGLSTF